MEARPLHILLVEDDDVDIMNVRRALAKLGSRAVLSVARDGIEGLGVLRQGAPQDGRRLVLLDINMPRMNGIEMLRELRADPELRSMPVVMLTTSCDEGDRLAAFDLNVAGYLLKPVGFSSFLDIMAALDAYWSRSEMP